jgi:hypothetical protein
MRFVGNLAATAAKLGVETPQGMSGRDALLETAHMQQALPEIDLLPA